MLISYAGAERRGCDDHAAPKHRPGNYRGRKPGSKSPVFTREDDAEIVRLYRAGVPLQVIAERLGQPRTNIFKRCRQLDLPLRLPRWKGGL